MLKFFQRLVIFSVLCIGTAQATDWLWAGGIYYTNQRWGSNNWSILPSYLDNGFPSASDRAFFGTDDFVGLVRQNALAPTHGQSISYIYLGPYGYDGTHRFTVSFDSDQTIGPCITNGAGSNGGTMITNNTPGTQQQITFVSDALYGGVSASGTSADTLLIFNGNSQNPNTWYSDQSPAINATLDVQNSTDVLLFTNSDTNQDTVALQGPLTGAGTIQASNTSAGTLTLVLHNTSGNTLSGSMQAGTGTTITPMVANSFPANAALSLLGGSLDLTNLTPSTSPVMTASASTISSSSTVKVVIDATSNHTTFVNLSNGVLTSTGFTLNVDVINGTLTTNQPYTLFTNAGVGSPATLEATLTGVTLSSGVTSSVSLSGTTYSLLLSLPSSSSSTSLSAPSIKSIGSSKSFTTAVTSTGVTRISSVMLEGSRAEASGRTGGLSSDTTFSFTSNPFQAPNINTATLSMTDGGLRQSVQETREKFRPLKLGKTSIWAQPFGSVLSQDTMYGQLGFKARTGGILFGGDYHLRPEIIVGGGIGYAMTKLTMGSNGGKTNIKDKFLTVFGTYFKERFYIDGSLVLGIQRYAGYRNIVSANLSASSHHNGYQITPHLGGGYNFRTHELYPCQIFAAFDYVYAHQQGYTETGAGTQNLIYQGSTATMLRSEVGGKIDRTFEHNDTLSKVIGRLSIVNKKPFQKGTIVTANAGTFEPTIKTENYISPGLEAKHEWEDGMSVGFAYSGEFGTKYVANELSLTVKKRL